MSIPLCHSAICVWGKGLEIPSCFGNHMEAIKKDALATHQSNTGGKTPASKTKKSDKTKYWRTCGTSVSLTLRWGACRSEHPLWKPVHYPVKLKISASCDCAVTLWSMDPVEMHTYACQDTQTRMFMVCCSRLPQMWNHPMPISRIDD